MEGPITLFWGGNHTDQTILCSMPIHILSILNLPKGTHNELNQIFSSFLWNTTDGSKKWKWISWRKNCFPIEECGLGNRDFEEVQRALFMRFAWKLMVGNSFWAEFFHAKYMKNKPVALLKSSPTHSRFWKGVVSALQIVLQNSFCRVRDGTSNFLYDNWNGTQSLVEAGWEVNDPHYRLKTYWWLMAIGMACDLGRC